MSRGTFLAPASLVLALTAAGCLTASQQSRLQTDMSDVRQQVFDMQKSTAEILTKLEGMEETLSRQEGASPTRFADLETLIQSLSDQVRTLGARLDDNTARMATLSHEIALARQQYRALDARLAAALATRGMPSPPVSGLPGGPGGPGVDPVPPRGNVAGSPPGSMTPGATTGDPAGALTSPGSVTGGATPATVNPNQPTTTANPMAGTAPAMAGAGDAGDAAAQESAFRSAYSDYTRGVHESALTGFREFLKAWPNSPLAEGAEYYAGDCLFSQQRYDEASAAFSRVIERYPASDKAPAAHLKKGLSLLALKQTARGVIQLQHVIETYPRSEEARLARDNLRQLGLSVR